MAVGKIAAFVGVVAFALIASNHFISQGPIVQDDMRSLWNTWKTQYGKVYATQHEEEVRFSIFNANYLSIQEFNSNPENTFVKAMNKFGDLTGEEFKAQYASCHNNGEGVGDQYCPSAVNCPTFPESNNTSINWTAKGAVTPIKNQGQCGSCWAFSTTGSLEGLYYITKNLLVSMSEQQIVDCATQCYGCDGCWPYLAMNYTATYGIEPEKLYPYTAVQGTCKYNKALALTVNTGYQCVTQKSPSQMAAALNQQPVSIAVEADQSAWQFYKKGVVTSGCGANLDHAVLLTGMGQYEGKQAWYVKNSWGTDWGDNGYIWLGQTSSPNSGYGVCGVLRCGTIPTNS